MKIQIGGFAATLDWEIAVEGAGYLWGLSQPLDQPIAATASDKAFEEAFVKGTEFEDDPLDEAIRWSMAEAWKRGVRAGRPGLFSVAQVAKIAGVVRRYILDEIQAERLPASKIGATYVIFRHDLEIWLANPARGSRSKKSE